jgi:hypothetical protein
MGVMGSSGGGLVTGNVVGTELGVMDLNVGAGAGVDVGAATVTVLLLSKTVN